ARLLDDKKHQNDTVPDVVPWDASQLPPKVEWRWDEATGRLHVQAQARSGGVGPVGVFLNGRRIVEDLRPPGFTGETLDVDVNLTKLDSYHPLPGVENQLTVEAFNTSHTVAKRGVGSITVETPDADEPITIWGLLVGVNDYQGEDLDLRYPAEDARALHAALQLGGQALFEATEAGEVELTLLTTGGAHAPSRENVEAALAEIAEKAGPKDVVLVYLSGHGVTNDADYYFPLPDARASDLKNPDLLAARSLSMTQLQGLLAKVPANKQVLILDTCEAGGAAKAGSVSYLQQRQLERLQDNSGAFILAAAGDEARAYEDTRYGHGLLTYALLSGMRGEATFEGDYWDVSTLFGHAVDAVPDLAETAGLQQRPLLATPGGGQSFVIGRGSEAVREAIPLQGERPVVLRPQLLNADFSDPEGLSAAMERALQEAAARPQPLFSYVDRSELPQAWKLTGGYRVDARGVTLDARLRTPDGEIRTFTLRAADVEALTACAAWQLEERIQGRTPKLCAP
ncbi:MAG: caspase family protein, partial [Alphaproteobacteria bacterium]|nr:caspase family protein [Alphaproteobacteria bacterium]